MYVKQRLKKKYFDYSIKLHKFYDSNFYSG